MKKILLSASALMLAALSMSAQVQDLSPVEGEINLDVNESGISALNFKLDKDAVVNRDANLFATLYYEGTPIAKVPASNTKQISFDGIMSDVWQIAFFLSPNKLAKQNGKYQVVLDEGLFLLGEDKTPMAEQTFNYYIDTMQVVVTPSPGQVYSIQDFTITFPSFKEVRYVEDKMVYVYDIYGLPDENENPILYIPEMDIVGNEVSLFLTNEINTRGTWCLSAEEGAFILIDEDGNEITSPAIDERWIIPNYIGGQATVTPAPGFIEYFPGEIYLHLPAGLKVQNVNTMAPSYIYMVDEEGNLGESIARYQGFKVNEDLSVVRLANWNGKDLDITPAPGNYRLVTGNMLYSVVGQVGYQSSMSYDYTVVNSNVKYVVTPNPEDELKSLGDIYIEFPEAQTVEVVNSKYSWLSSNLSNYQFYPSIAQDKPNTVRFHTGVPVTFPGSYELYCDSSTIKVDGQFISICPVFNIVDDGSRVAEITDEIPDTFDVVSVEGVVILKNVSEESLLSLPKGIYIVAGKKVCIK